MWSEFPVQTLIKIVSISVQPDAPVVDVTFSDGSQGPYDMGYLFERGGPMIEALTDPAYFRRAFIEAGALAWPNGFDLAPEAIHRRLKEAGKLCEPVA